MRAWRGPRWVRVLMGVWLSLVLSDAGLIHACQPRDATHGAPTSAMASETVPAPASLLASHEGHHGHDGAHGPAAPADGGTRGVDRTGPVSPDTGPNAPGHDGHDGHGTRDCSCLGHCCPPVPLAMAVSADFAFTRVVLATTARPGRPTHAVRAAWADYVLPFGTAPPARVV